MRNCMKDMQAKKDMNGPNVKQQERKSGRNTNLNYTE